jgi:hypothetical protein
VDGRHAVQFLIDGAEQNLSPKAFHDSCGLVLFGKPLSHRDLIEIAANGRLSLKSQQPSRKRKFFPNAQELETDERFEKVCRSGKDASLKPGNSPSRLDEVERFVKLDFVRNSQPPVEVE